MTSTQQTVLPVTADLESDVSLTSAKVMRTMHTAALQFVRAGIHDGEFQITPEAALAAAAETFQRLYDRESLHALMAAAAQRAGVKDAYQAVLAQP